jgi:ribosomal-protein-alanine N-acetyltransferase
VLRVNALAFGPFWQYDDAVVLGWMLTSDRSVVAEVDGNMVGFAITTMGLSGNYAHLIRVATHPGYRGRGIGRQLVVDSISFARDLGSPGLALNTQGTNRISRTLYESLGFRQTGHALAVMVYRL